MRIIRGIFAPALFAAFVVSCSSGDKESLPKEASTGFELKKDAFQFENFASGYDGSRMTADLAARMFGKDKVCQKGLSYCEPTTDAQIWIDSANDSMDSGRCEGFAVLSQLFFLGRLDPKKFGGQSAADLKLEENYALQKELAYWFSTQLVPNAVENTALMPRDALKFMAEFMRGKEEFYRIGMVERTPSGFGDAHSLTPIAFEQSGDDANIYYIRVYDNNFPAVERRIRLDVAKNSWEYEGVNSEGTMMFRGSEADGNPLYFAPTIARAQTLPCPFCKGENRRTLIAHGASPLLKDGMGNEVGFKDGKIVETNGGKVTPGFAMCTDGVAPVVVTANTPSDMPVEVTLNPNGSSYQSVRVQGGSLGSVSVGGDLSSKQAAQLQVSGDTIKLQSGGTSTSFFFVAEGGTIVEVNVKGDAGNVEISRDAMTGKLSIKTDDANGAEVQVTLSHNVVNNPRSTTTVKTSYSFTAGEGDSQLSIDLPKDGWQGTTPPSATLAMGKESAPLAGDLCGNNAQDGNETDKDCGGGKCGACYDGSSCKVGSDCQSTVCGGPGSTNPGHCVDHCADGVMSADETDVDCGGARCIPCVAGKMCKSASDCFPPDKYAESFPFVRYDRKPFYRCDAGVCTASTLIVGYVDYKYDGVQVRLTPDGLGDDPKVQRIASVSTIANNRAFFAFPRTFVKDQYQIEVVKQPSTDVACSVSVPDGGKTNGEKYLGPIVGYEIWVPGGFEVTCAPYTTLCANGKKDFRETDIDCGGGDCSPLSKRCGLGKTCLADSDCGADGQNAVCSDGTCKKTYEVRGSLYTTVPLTLKLTPGGSSSGSSSTPRTLAVTPQQTSFAFTDTRVTSTYALTYEEPAGVTCKATGATGDATGVTDTFVNTATLSCTSCANGQREGKETGVDCGGADCRSESKLCAATVGCGTDADCVSGSCDGTSKVCLSASCTNKKKDGTETGVDCGGTTCVNQGFACDLTIACGENADCKSGTCDGTSQTCVSCGDGVKNGSETAVDCGGTKCVSLNKTCALTDACGNDADCASGICDPTSKKCVSCGDGAKNGAETAVDCGGTKCLSLNKTCALTDACGSDADCASGTCDPTSKTCVSCGDGAKNGAETAADCGGTKCVAEGKTCKLNEACAKSSDCNDTLICASSVCKASASWTATAQSSLTATTVRDAVALAVDNIWAIADDKLGHYNGTSWTTETPFGADTQILSMFARTDTTVAADVIWVGGADNVMKYWNGSQWFTQTTDFPGTTAIHGIHGTSSLVLAVGSEGQIARYKVLEDSFASEFSSSGGLPGAGGPAPTSQDLHAVFVLDDSHAWAVGNGGAIVTLNSGNWSLATSNTTANLRGVWARTVDDVWAVGEGGIIVHFSASSWSTVSSGTTSNLASIWGADASNIWTVGAGGKIRYFNGEGVSGETSGTTADLGAVFGFNQTRWALGTGTVLVERN